MFSPRVWRSVSELSCSIETFSLLFLIELSSYYFPCVAADIILQATPTSLRTNEYLVDIAILTPSNKCQIVQFSYRNWLMVSHFLMRVLFKSLDTSNLSKLFTEVFPCTQFLFIMFSLFSHTLSSSTNVIELSSYFDLVLYCFLHMWEVRQYTKTLVWNLLIHSGTSYQSGLWKLCTNSIGFDWSMLPWTK